MKGDPFAPFVFNLRLDVLTGGFAKRREKRGWGFRCRMYEGDPDTDLAILDLCFVVIFGFQGRAREDINLKANNWLDILEYGGCKAEFSECRWSSASFLEVPCWGEIVILSGEGA